MLEKKLDLIKDLTRAKNICTQEDIQSNYALIKKLHSCKNIYILLKQYIYYNNNNLIVIANLKKILSIITLIELVYYTHLLNTNDIKYNWRDGTLNNSYYKALDIIYQNWELKFDSIQEIELIISKYNLILLHTLKYTIVLLNREIMYKKLCFLLKNKNVKKKN